MPDAKPPAQPVNKWIQSIFWPISCLPTLSHYKDHTTGDYVGRSSPLLGTCVAFWLCLVAVIGLYLVNSGMVKGFEWRHADVALGVFEAFLAVIYIAGFYQFFSREEEYPN